MEVTTEMMMKIITIVRRLAPMIMVMMCAHMALYTSDFFFRETLCKKTDNGSCVDSAKGNNRQHDPLTCAL